MPIQLIIFLTKTKLFACEINKNGKAEAISIKGNTEIKCEGKESVDELITCLFDAFNIDDFADDNFDIVIIESDADREVIKYLATRCDGASKFNIISMEKIMPVIASSKNIIKAREETIVNFSDNFYKITCNENNIVKIDKTNEVGDAFALEISDFTCLYYFVANTVVATVDDRNEDTEQGNAYEIYQKAKQWQEVGNYQKAFELYNKAADMGNLDARAELGRCYLNGYGVQKDVKKALAYSSEAAEAGIARAQFDLGIMCYYGLGVPQNYFNSVAWYTKAAEQGDADAQNSLGFMFLNGNGVRQDYSQAVTWFFKAAEQGNAYAQCNLGNMYFSGQGVPQDYFQAVAWYLKAAKQGNAEAQYILGNMYFNGNGVLQDYSQAVAWYCKAAEQGHANAQNNLGYAYHYGYGVPPDYDEAVKWYRKAAEQGNSIAIQHLNSLGEFIG